MRKFLVLTLAVILTLFIGNSASAQCTKIQSGAIVGGNGVPVTVGYDMWGYNYQAHMFNGLSANYTRPMPPATDGLDSLVMKWSDEWLSNVDCNGDNKLDRGLDVKVSPLSDGISKGWLTNHYEGDYLGDDGELHHYTYFVKIVWVGPAIVPDPWADKRIWGQYAVIEEVNNDPYGGFHGVSKENLVNPAGLGFWTK